MSIIPEFELGLWNAWIFILPIIVASIFGANILGRRKAEEGSSVPKKAKTLSNLYFLILLVSYAYSVFLPLKLNTLWFVVGLLIYLPVMAFLVLGLLSFATTPVDNLVTKGVYGISRNPSYVSAVLITMSIGIACLSWFFLLVAIANFLLLRYYVVVVEEPFLLNKYGDAYRKYTSRTPRWLGIPNSKKIE